MTGGGRAGRVDVGGPRRGVSWGLGGHAADARCSSALEVNRYRRGVDQRHKDDLLPVGEIAHRAGISVPTVRFYEERGLIGSTRTAGNQRRFARHTLRRIAYVRAAQRFGLSLAEIREALDTLPADRAPTKGTGLASRGAGTTCSRSASRPSSGCATRPTAASGAAACRPPGARSTTPTTSSPPPARVPDDGPTPCARGERIPLRPRPDPHLPTRKRGDHSTYGWVAGCQDGASRPKGDP